VELVACAGKAPEAQALEAVMRLQMRKTHLDPLPLITRSQERLCFHFTASDIAGSFIDVAHDPARRRVGAAPLFQGALTAAEHGCEVADCMIAVNPATRRQCLACRTDIDVALAVESELRPRERAVVSLAHVPHGNMRDDAGPVDEGQEPAGPIGRVGREPLGG